MTIQHRFGDLVTRTLRRLSQESGAGVQIYSEDRVAEMLNHKFIITLDRLWWKDYMAWTYTTVANGLPADNMTTFGLKRFADIKYVFYQDHRDPLVAFKDRYSPVNIGQSDGEPYYFDSVNHRTTPDKVFQILPKGIDGASLAIHHRVLDNYPFGPDDLVAMDDQLLILGATYDYLEDDGSNPGATQKMLGLFEQRFEQLRSNEEVGDIPINPRGSSHAGGQWQTIVN